MNRGRGSRCMGAVAAAVIALAIGHFTPAAELERRGSWLAGSLSGEILAAEPVPSGPRAGCMVLLSERDPPGTSRELLLLCADGVAATLEPLGQAPSDASSVAVDSRGDRAIVWVGVRGGLLRGELGAGGQLGTLERSLSDTRLHPYSLNDRPDIDSDGSPDLVQALAEGLAAWRRGADGTLAPLGLSPVPSFAVVGAGGALVRGREMRPGVPATSARWSSPVVEPPDRLSVLRVPVPGSGDAQTCTAWINVGGRRRVSSWVVDETDTPRLVALTVTADRVDLLGEYSLVVAPLECDETRRGRAPTLDASTRYPVYRPPRVELRDVTGDGLLEIVAIGVTGRLRPNAEVTIWPADSTRSSPVRWSERVERGAVALDWSQDVTGDGLPDFIALDEKGLTLYAGIWRPARRVPIESRSAAVLPWPRRSSSPVLIGYVAAATGNEARQLPVVMVNVASEGAGSQRTGLLVGLPARAEGD